MRLAELGDVARDTTGPAWWTPVAACRQRGRGHGFGLGWAVIVAAAVAHALVMTIGPTADSASSDDVGAGVLAQLPVLLVLGAGTRLGRRVRPSLATLRELDSRAERAERAEAALMREHERVHEMRATLAGVSTAYQVLRDPRARLSPVRRDRLQRLHDREMERLERLLSNRRDPVRSVDLDAVIEPLAESSRLQGTEVTFTGSGCSARARHDDVSQIVHVLLENAARHAAGGAVEVAVAAHGREVEVRVTDRGPGISPGLVPRLFERGVRGPGSSGQGLGLSIAERLAREMGGRLQLAPRRDGQPGATFVLRLPTRSSDPSDPRDPRDSRERSCLAASS